MIDVTAERIVNLHDARKLLNRNGKPIGRTTIWRWYTRGVRGVLLETVLVGGICCTSYEAIQRFAERLTSAARGQATVDSNPRTPSRKFREHTRAGRELAAAGY